MRSSPVSLYLRVRSPEGGWLYARSVTASNGRIRPLHALIDGKPVYHETFGVQDGNIPYPDTYWPFTSEGIDAKWNWSDQSASPLEKYMSVANAGGKAVNSITTTRIRPNTRNLSFQPPTAIFMHPRD